MSLSADRVGLPPKPFLYTIDQLSALLDLDEDYIKQNLLHYAGRSTGSLPKSKMYAVNIAAEGEKPEWRVPERRLISWMRFRGIRYYERGYVK